MSQKRYISRISGEPRAEPICPQICMWGDVEDVITCAEFQNEMLRCYDSTGVEIFIFLLISNGHYNSAVLLRCCNKYDVITTTAVLRFG